LTSLSTLMHRLDTATEQGQGEWLDQVYSNTALLTAVADHWESRSLRSSSSMPGLMTRMLETLDVQDGNRVLEIGTGTGYNVALLAHRLGEANVFSVDVEPDLIDLARQRLARIGYHPTLVAADGAAGLAEHAPFDRIIATCAVPAVPWAWVEQTSPAGVILTDLKAARGAAVWSASPATPTALRDASTRPTQPSWTCATTRPTRPRTGPGPADNPTARPRNAPPH
jgi:protein-L-isoaspartate(D-aspartate) O-methyltransferase